LVRQRPRFATKSCAKVLDKTKSFAGKICKLDADRYGVPVGKGRRLGCQRKGPPDPFVAYSSKTVRDAIFAALQYPASVKNVAKVRPTHK
jgi:hypothetical protein